MGIGATVREASSDNRNSVLINKMAGKDEKASGVSIRTALITRTMEAEILSANSTSSTEGLIGTTIIVIIKMINDAPTTSERAEARRAKRFSVSITAEDTPWKNFLMYLCGQILWGVPFEIDCEPRKENGTEHNHYRTNFQCAFTGLI